MTHLRSAPRLAWLGALLAALLMALLAPALARADEGTAGGTAVAEQPVTTSDAPAGDAAAADETAAPEGAASDASATEPAATEPAAPPSEGTTAGEPAEQQPTAPPSAGEVDLPTIALPPLGELIPTEAPAPAGEAAATSAPSLPELVPLIAAPEAPRATLLVPPVDVPQALPGGPAGAVMPTRAAQSVTVGAGALGGPPAIHAAAPLATTSRAAADGAAVSVPLRSGLISLDPSHRVDPSGPAVAGGSARGPVVFGGEDAPAQIAAPQLVSPAGPAPAQSLLAVLASYILPGSGPVPAGTIFLLVMLGVVLLAAGAPRLGGSERIWLSGLVGPGSGHGLAVRRPG